MMEETRQQVDGVGQGDPHVGALLCLDRFVFQNFRIYKLHSILITVKMFD